MNPTPPLPDHTHEVEFQKVDLFSLDIAETKRIQDQAELMQRKRFRLCAHPDEDDLLHEMMIVVGQGAYVRPHQHPGKSESFHVISGRADAIFFEEDGSIKQIIEMGDFNSGLTYYYRTSQPLYHGLLIYSEQLIFHETKNGPFLPGETAYAPWAPDEDDVEEVVLFMETLNQKVKGLKNG